DAGLLEEAEVSDPVDEAELPGSEGNVVAVGQAARHAASVRQGVAGVAAVAVEVDLHVRNTRHQHRLVIVESPDGVDPVTGAAAAQKWGGDVLGDRRGGRVASEWCGPGVDESGEVRTRRDAGERVGGIVVLLAPVFVEDGWGSGELGAGREAHHAD